MFITSRAFRSLQIDYGPEDLPCHRLLDLVHLVVPPLVPLVPILLPLRLQLDSLLRILTVSRMSYHISTGHDVEAIWQLVFRQGKKVYSHGSIPR